MTEQDCKPEPIVLLEDCLAEMDHEMDRGGERSERWWGRQRLAHAVGSLVTTLLLLAWALYTAAPGFAYRLVHCIAVGH
ncbi:MAG TPA: hypothetical protein VJX92_08275 [Methylomirabilota bacterium]|nr:hypothetical protein [Methylomirabilota bacterium]